MNDDNVVVINSDSLNLGRSEDLTDYRKTNRRLNRRAQELERALRVAQSAVTHLTQNCPYRGALVYIAENASGGDVPESWPVWAADFLANKRKRFS